MHQFILFININNNIHVPVKYAVSKQPWWEKKECILVLIYSKTIWVAVDINEFFFIETCLLATKIWWLLPIFFKFKSFIHITMT